MRWWTWRWHRLLRCHHTDFGDESIKSTRCRKLKYPGRTISFHLERVRNALGQENVAASFDPHLTLATAKPQPAFQDVEHFIFHMMDVQRGTETWWGMLLDQRKSVIHVRARGFDGYECPEEPKGGALILRP